MSGEGSVTNLYLEVQHLKRTEADVSLSSVQHLSLQPFYSKPSLIDKSIFWKSLLKLSLTSQKISLLSQIQCTAPALEEIYLKGKLSSEKGLPLKEAIIVATEHLRLIDLGELTKEVAFVGIKEPRDLVVVGEGEQRVVTKLTKR